MIQDALYVIVVFFAILMVAGLIGLAIGFWIAHGETITGYKDCISQQIPPKICNALFPPLKLQNVSFNGSAIPFP